MNNELRQQQFIKTSKTAKTIILNTQINTSDVLERPPTNDLFEEEAYGVFLKAVKLMPVGSVLSLFIENNAQSVNSERQLANDLSFAPIAGQQIPSAQATNTDGITTDGTLSDKQLMTRIYEYIKKHIQEENLSIKDLMQTCVLSRSQLFRKVRAITNKTPAQVVRDYRLDTAYCLIETDTRLRISEVMYAVGLSDTKHFGKIFKKRFGISPKEVKHPNVR